MGTLGAWVLGYFWVHEYMRRHDCKYKYKYMYTYLVFLLTYLQPLLTYLVFLLTYLLFFTYFFTIFSYLFADFTYLFTVFYLLIYRIYLLIFRVFTYFFYRFYFLIYCFFTEFCHTQIRYRQHVQHDDQPPLPNYANHIELPSPCKWRRTGILVKVQSKIYDSEST
jgi:hypothetical protein